MQEGEKAAAEAGWVESSQDRPGKFDMPQKPATGGLKANIENINNALEFLRLGWEAFRKGEMRDAGLERAGAEGADRAKAAAAEFEAALV